MSATLIYLFVFILAVASGLVVGLYFGKKTSEKTGKEREQELQDQIFQLSILSQIAQRISYSLDADEIVEVITGSLDPLLEASTIGFVLRDDEDKAIVTKVRLRESVSEEFVQSVQKNMRDAFDLLCGEECKTYKEKLTVVGEQSSITAVHHVGSYFNLPVVLEGKAVAIINVSSTEKDFYTSEKTDILYQITRLAPEAVSRLRGVIRDEQRRMNAMVSALPSGIFMVDQDERVVVYNDQLLEILDFKEGELVRLSDILERTRKDIALHELMLQSSDKQEMILGEVIERDGQYEQVAASPVEDNTGETIGTIVTFQDITAQMELQQLREQFTAMLVHELRSPLTAIRWNMEELPEMKATKKNLREVSGDVLATVNRLLALVNDMLDSSKLDAGEFTINPTQGDLRTLIQTTMKNFASTAKAKGLKLESELSDLPAISFDENRIQQVMANLVSNAVKYTEQGEITVRAIEKDGGIRVEVADTGLGVEKADQSKLFKRFQQLSKGGLKEEGTGLGLMIVKGIIEAHGGAVGFEPNKPQGSVFWFELPSTTPEKK